MSASKGKKRGMILIVFGVVGGMTLLGSDLPGVESRKPEPEPCQMCHEAENYQWSFSVHAQSMNTKFLAEWELKGKDEECLGCHCGTYDVETGVLIEECVSCQDCHGPDNTDHPNEAKMEIPVTSDVCQSCHSYTWGQWRISAHGQKNIRCFDCHEMHQNELRREKPDELCGSCHAKRLDDFAHATHNISGLHCVTCHMPEPHGVHTKIGGTGVPGHLFSVEAQPCADCHREMVHNGHDLSALREKVEHLEEEDTEKLASRVVELTERTRNLERSLDTNNGVFPWIVIISFTIGIFSGSAILLFYQRRRHRLSSS